MPPQTHLLAARPTGAVPSRILIVDDSVVARAVIGKLIEQDARFTVAGAVSDANGALAFLRDNAVDIMLLDIEMPGIDGLTALPDLMAAGAGARILVVSSSCAEGAAATIQALTLGAADTLVKPGLGNLVGKFGDALIEKLTRLIDGHDRSIDVAATVTKAVPIGDDFDIVAIGASTGGIHALSQLLRAIPVGFQVPILITQHLPASFMPYFAAQIAVLAGRRCVVATDHMRIAPAGVIIAPGDAHMYCVSTGDSAAIRLHSKPAASGCMPSVDPMFESVADVFGARALAVVLSGMGRDGMIGAGKVAARGGTVIAQDKQSSVVWGMPGSVAAAGHASALLPPEGIGRLIATRRRPA